MIFILFVFSMYPWFVWNSGLLSSTIILTGAIFSIFYWFFNRSIFCFNKKNIICSFILAISLLFYSVAFNLFGIVQNLFVFILLLFLLNINDHFKVRILDFITKWFAIFLSISLFYYILFLMGISLPFTYIDNSDLGYTGNNYYLFVVDHDIVFFPRFRSIFAEPGHLTMGIIPLLFANRFNLKNKFVVILLLVEIFTLSLAGFVLIFFSLFLLLFFVKNKIYIIILNIILIISSITVYKSANNDNVFYRIILARLTYDDNKESIAGNNRTDSYVDSYFKNYIYSTDAIFGLGFEKSNQVTSAEGAGFKIFLLRFGIVTSILTLFLYFSLAFNYLNKPTFGFLIILVLLLLQNAYPFMFCIIFIYILGIPKLYLKADVKIA
jgi:hypothetical protein